MDINQRLRAAREAAGFKTKADAARAAGVPYPTYAGHENGARGAFKLDEAATYARVFRVNIEWLLTGKGPMHKGQVQETAETTPPPNVDLTTAVEVPRPNTMPYDLPVYGVAVGGSDGDFSLNGDVVDRVRRPPGLLGNRSAFAVYVRGDSMEPRHSQGDLLYVDPARPARSGDDVLVELKPSRPGEPGQAYIKQLVTQGPVRVVLRQFNPAKDITLPGDKILRVSKILKLADLLGF